MTALNPTMPSGDDLPARTYSEMAAVLDLIFMMRDLDAFEAHILKLGEERQANDISRAASDQSAAKARKAWEKAEAAEGAARERILVVEKAGAKAETAKKDALAAVTVAETTLRAGRDALARDTDALAQRTAEHEKGVARWETSSKTRDQTARALAVNAKLVKEQAETLMERAEDMKADYESKFAELGAIVSRKPKGG